MAPHRALRGGCYDGGATGGDMGEGVHLPRLLARGVLALESTGESCEERAERSVRSHGGNERSSY